MTTTGSDVRHPGRVVWSAGDWDGFASIIAPVGAVAIERAGIEPGHDVLDIGTGNGCNVAIPAAQLGARVVGADVTPELLEPARRHAAAAGVEVEWIEADAQQMPFGDHSFDRVISTFGAMFAPGHAETARELVRVCRPGGRIVMTTWATAGFAGAMFALNGRFLPPPPAGAGTPPQWGDEAYVGELFAQAGAPAPTIERRSATFAFDSLDGAVAKYADQFGPFVVARAALEPQGRWDDFIGEFTDLVREFDEAPGDDVRVSSEYLLITVEP